MTIHEKLLNFAREVAYPYLSNMPCIVGYKDKISILLVGSVAKGLCTETSDVDLCFLCRPRVWEAITQNGKIMCGAPPPTVEIENTMIQYWAMTPEFISARVAEYDEIILDTYGNAIVLNDNLGLYGEVKNIIFNDEPKSKRKEVAVGSLLLKNEELKQFFKTSSDPVMRIKIGFEVIELLLKATALSDNILYDGRKRLYITALSGDTGKKLSDKIDKLINSLAEISKTSNKTASEFMQNADECISIINKVGH